MKNKMVIEYKQLIELPTLRNCAASTLNELSQIYKATAFNIISPLIGQLLTKDNWIYKYFTYKS